MARFAVRRLLSMVLVLFAISVLTFAIFQAIPNGNPAYRLAGRTATPETIKSVEQQWGFDQSLPTQYGITMRKIFTGDVISYSQQINVESQIWQRLPNTFSLALGAGIMWLVVSIAFGLLSAVRAGRATDRLLTVFAMIGVSTPVFFLGAVALYVFAYKITIFPNTGYVALTQNPWQWLTHLILPWITLSILFVGIYSRLLRSNILDTINDDYVRTARAKGIGERQVMVRHVLRNSLIPIFSLWGLDFAAVLGGGAILTESVFNLEGVGQYAFQSVQQLDVPPVLVITMFTAFFVVLLSALIDVLYAYLDPRIRLS